MNRRELIALGAARLLACSNRQSDAGFVLTDVTTQAGIAFRHNSGAFGAKYLPETMGPGAAFIDYDGDGWLDVLLINGMDWPGHKQRRTSPTPREWPSKGF